MPRCTIGNAQEPHYSGGVTLDHANVNHVYYAKQTSATVWELFEATTHDSGASWTHRQITRNSAKKNVRPVVPLGYTAGEFGVIWMYGDYTYWTGPNYKTALRAYPPALPDPKRVLIPIIVGDAAWGETTVP